MSSAVPEGWEVKRLGELCNSVRGVSYKPDDLYSIKSDSTATLLRSNNIQSGQLIFNNVQFVDRRKVKERQIVRTGDIAICMSNGSKRLVGKNGIFPQTHQSDIVTVGAFCSIIRTKEGGNETFISQVLKSDEFFKQVEFSLAGSAINNLKDGDVEDYLFSFPPLPEQKKIASILTSVDEVIENTQKQIDKLQDLKKATMNELLTKGIGHTEFKDSELGRIPKSWEVGEVSIYCEEVFLGLTSKVDYVDSGGVPLIRATDISKGRLSFEKVRCISEAQHQKLTKYRQASRGDILVSKSGSLGVCAIVDTDKEFSIYESIIVLKPIESKLQSQYLLWFMRSPLTQQQLQGDKVGSTVGHLNLNDFRNLKITIPSLIEQNLISQQIVAMNELEKSLEQKLSQTQSLKKSLMQDLLTGKVRVTVN